MNETDLKNAFNDTLTTGAPPLALDAARMLGRARRARHRRRIGLATGTVALVAASVAGAAALYPALSGGSPRLGSAGSPTCSPAAVLIPEQMPVPVPEPTMTAAPLTAAPLTGGALPPTCPQAGTDTERPWPSGQSDRTARSGPHAQRAEQVLAALVDSLPAGYRSATPWQQAQFADWDGATEVWEYAASIGVTKAGRTGFLLGHGTRRTLSNHLQSSDHKRASWGGEIDGTARI